jgi:hypothetical protein
MCLAIRVTNTGFNPSSQLLQRLGGPQRLVFDSPVSGALRHFSVLKRLRSVGLGLFFGCHFRPPLAQLHGLAGHPDPASSKRALKPM